MKKLTQKANLIIEHLFQQAMREEYKALLIISILSKISRTFRGLWLFRKGDVSESLATLQQIKSSLSVVKNCTERSEFILEQLQTGYFPPISKKIIKLFNNRVLMAVHSNGYFYPNGYAVRTSLITSSLKKKGVIVSAITRPGYPWDLGSTAEKPVVEETTYAEQVFTHSYDKYNRISGSEDKYIKLYVSHLELKAKEEDVTVIHAHSSYLNGLAAAKAADKLGILSVYEMRGLWHLSRAVKEPLFENTEHYKYCEKMELLAAQSCDKVVTLNNAIKDWLIENGIRENKITVIPNGALTPIDTIQNTKNTQFNLGFFGSITRYEGLDDAIMALSKLKRSDIKLNIYGQGEYASDLQNLVTKLGLSKQVTFKGQISKSDLPRAYADTSAVLITRKNLKVTRLVTPLKLVEAMQMGKPCIVSNLPALKEVVEDNVDALLVKPNNTEDIARAILKLAEDKKLCETLSRQAMINAQEKLNWDNSSSRYFNVYGSDS